MPQISAVILLSTLVVRSEASMYPSHFSPQRQSAGFCAVLVWKCRKGTWTCIGTMVQSLLKSWVVSCYTSYIKSYRHPQAFQHQPHLLLQSNLSPPSSHWASENCFLLVSGGSSSILSTFYLKCASPSSKHIHTRYFPLAHTNLTFHVTS